MTLLSLLLVALFTYANATDVKQRLQRVPPPAPFFNEAASLGRWFVHYRLAGCNYASSDSIDDFTQYLVRGRRGMLISHETWRNDICNTLSTQHLRQRTPGVYTIKDPIGAIWSGTAVYVAIDYKRFKIMWGCTKMSVRGDACDDPFLNVYTRSPKPDPLTFAAVNDALQQIFGISLGSLPRTIHGKPCRGFAPRMRGGKGGKGGKGIY